MVVAPLTDRFLPDPLKATVSLVPLPNTASPVMASAKSALTVWLKVTLVALNAVSAPRLTALLNAWVLLVVMRPPLISVVPLLAFCTRLVASTVLVNVVLPVLVRAMLPKPREPPTAPVKVIWPVPEVMVKSLVSSLCELTVPLKITELLVVARLKPEEISTASPYCCAPPVVTLPFNLVLPPLSVVMDKPFTAALKVVVPAETRLIAPKLPLLAPPTIPLKVMAPDALVKLKP